MKSNYSQSATAREAVLRHAREEAHKRNQALPPALTQPSYKKEATDHDFRQYVLDRYLDTKELIRFDYPTITDAEFKLLWKAAVLPFI